MALAVLMALLVATRARALQLAAPAASLFPHRVRSPQATRAAPVCAASAASTPRAVFVSNVAWEASHAELKSVCERRFGPVDEAWLAPDRRGLNHAGWGKIVFAQPASAQASLAAGTELTLHGREVSVGLRDPATEKSRRRRTQQKDSRDAAACDLAVFEACTRVSTTPVTSRRAGATPPPRSPDPPLAREVPRLQAERASAGAASTRHSCRRG